MPLKDGVCGQVYAARCCLDSRLQNRQKQVMYNWLPAKNLETGVRMVCCRLTGGRQDRRSEGRRVETREARARKSGQPPQKCLQHAMAGT